MTGKARYLRADRSQLKWDMVDLDSQLALDHRARVVWAFVGSLNLSALYEGIGSREDSAGRPPPDPAMGVGRPRLVPQGGRAGGL